jgi:predicted DNA-binding ribbon-helix-helix protein
MSPKRDKRKLQVIARTQTGIRLEKRILKVLKGIAAYHETTLGNLIEGICLHVFEGKLPFNEKNLKKINEIKRVYGLELTAADSHHLAEEE